MKTYYLSIIVLVIALFSQSSLNAQVSEIAVIDTTAKKNFQHIHFGLYAGGVLPSYTFKGEGLFNNLKGKGSFARKMGVFIEIGVPNYLEGLSFQVGLEQAQKQLIFSEHIVNSSESFTNYDIDYKVSFLKAPILINYKFGKGKIKPYAQLGYSIGLSAIAQNNQLVTTNQYNKSFVEASNDELFPTIENESSIVFGIGAMYMLTKRLGVFVQTHFSSDKHNALHDGNAVEVKSKTINLSGGLRF